MINKFNNKYRNKEWLYEHYIIKNFTSKKISNICNVDCSTIYNWLKRYNIKLKRKMSKYNRKQTGKKNPFYKRTHSEITKAKISLKNSGENSGLWKGNNIGYHEAHYRLRKEKGNPKKCDVCGTSGKNKTYDWASLTGNFLDINDYKRMCRSCHWKLDNKILNIKHMRKKLCI